MSAIPGSEVDVLEREHALEEAEFGARYLRMVCQFIHRLNANFYRDLTTGRPVEFSKELAGLKIALIHSEVSEMLEGVRKENKDEHLPSRMAEEVEAADAFIRLADYCAWRKLDLAGAVVDKLKYNTTREDHTNEARRAEGGKKF